MRAHDLALTDDALALLDHSHRLREIAQLIVDHLLRLSLVRIDIDLDLLAGVKLADDRLTHPLR